MAVMFPPVSSTASDASASIGSTFHEDVPSKTPSASNADPCAVTVPGTSTSTLNVVSGAHCVSGSGPLASHVGLDAATVPGTSTSSLDVVSGAHCVSSSGPSASHVGLGAATVPGTTSSSPSVVSDARSVSRVAGGAVDTGRPGDRSRLYASFDGGFRPLSCRCAFAWCVWSSDHQLIQWQATTFLESHSNNVMEAQGLLACLRWIRNAFSFPRVEIYGDSRVVISQALCRFVCRAPYLASLIGEIRALGTVDTLIYLHTIL
ncbi:hypothetical protein PF002_g29699 [Phytophthora fragariae]|uniref:Uncharacterized protein n=1 Tax=Phytophthora fragariae TaxID=53985 RepID=A0A6A3Q2I5_9STRA|nr:hypothetical protein PF003_g39711 [Phytophthora fragariae]KAE8921052.1 hypothetical protein PF009_g28660 [Phytophthora fragariae]KAE8963885.1 hypothetical protein PF011_g28872 [Phytophthora fragariae]KAE9062448.1 hypothetical protein PF007_g29906 [Phytophthora fragariae]KAE9067326.1 hypothetical protein PF006_g30022 [Phytophthora fragariae]